MAKEQLSQKEQTFSYTSQVSVGLGVSTPNISTQGNNSSNGNETIVELLKELIRSQNRQNDMLQSIVNQFTMAQKQKGMELARWKQANPQLAWSCHNAADKLSKVQMEILDSIVLEVDDNYENLMDSEYSLTDFLDRYGPRFVHLNAILQILSQLGSTSENTEQTIL